MKDVGGDLRRRVANRFEFDASQGRVQTALRTGYELKQTGHENGPNVESKQFGSLRRTTMVEQQTIPLVFVTARANTGV